MTISPNDGSFGSDRLPVLRSPTYGILTRQDSRQSGGEGSKIDLRTLLQSEGIETVRRRVSDVIVAQLSRVLHAREDDISRVRPLAEIGLDSLMALELVMNLEQAFGSPISLAASAGTLTVSGVADEIIAQFGFEHGHEEVVISTLAEQHLEKVEAGQLDVLKDMITEEPQKAKRLLS
jgi:acyl carrier protein